MTIPTENPIVNVFKEAKNLINALSLFAGIGIGEFYLDQCGIDVVLADEIVRSRAEAHAILHLRCEVLTADITLEET